MTLSTTTVHQGHILVKEVVLDFNRYPRYRLDEERVEGIAAAMRAGEVFPPITVEAGSKRCVDGFHRVKAALAVRGQEAKLLCRWRKYPDEQAFFLDSVALNATHGRPLDRWDVIRIVDIAQAQLKVDPKRIAGALHTTIDRVNKLTMRAAVPKNQPLERQPAVPEFTFQRRVAQPSGRLEQSVPPLVFKLDELLDLLAPGRLPRMSESIVIRLQQLQKRIGQLLR